MKCSCHSLILSCHYSAAANSEDSTEFNSSAPKLISRQAGVSKLDSPLSSLLCTTLCCRTLLYNHFTRTSRKTPSYIVKEACLLTRCLAMDALLLRAYAFVGMCSPSRCLAMGLRVTICIICFGEVIFNIDDCFMVPDEGLSLQSTADGDCNSDTRTVPVICRLLLATSIAAIRAVPQQANAARQQIRTTCQSAAKRDAQW
jgi:hypothetical protein